MESACSMRQEHSGSGGFLEFFFNNGKGASVCINSKPFCEVLETLIKVLTSVDKLHIVITGIIPSTKSFSSVP